MDKLEADYRAEVGTALAQRDWYKAYLWAKGWIGRGGGAWILDPWFVYASSALMQRKPRQATHSLDLALKTWIDAPPDRAVLRWARGAVVQVWLDDPKTALPDLEAAALDAPSWLHADAMASLATCQRDATQSRKRKPSVPPAPEFVGDRMDRAFVAPPSGPRAMGARPRFMDAFLAELHRSRDIPQR